MPYALCPMPYALCPMPYALCPMPYALCPLEHLMLLEKGYMMRSLLYTTVSYAVIPYRKIQKNPPLEGGGF